MLDGQDGVNKKIFKMSEGKCRICGDSDYALLDVHRIQEGADGGKYIKSNCVVLCCKCHRKVHDNQIKIYGYYLCSNGKYLLHIEKDDVELFL